MRGPGAKAHIRRGPAALVAGLALIALGLALGGGWYALAVVGLLPLAAGVFDFSVLSPLFRLPLSGKGTRQAGAARRA